MVEKIVLTGGGTAGHVIPCIAVAERLKDWEIHYIGRKSGIEKEYAQKCGYVYHGIDCPRFVRGNPLTLFTAVARLPFAVRQAKIILEAISPSVIFSKGGYVSLPVTLAAKKIPIVLHESDRSFGLANRLVRKKAIVCSSFPINYENVTHTGSPLPSEIYSGSRAEARRICGFTDGKPVLLVTGGSLGAQALNDAVKHALPILLKRYNVIHLTGKGKNCSPQKGYCPIEFTDKMYSLMALADAAVSRGGSNTIFELVALRVPTLIVPLPKGASRGDQIENAEYFAGKGWAITASQEKIERDGLMPYIDKLTATASDIKKACTTAKADGSDAIVKIIRNSIK